MNTVNTQALRAFRASLRSLEREIDLQLRSETGCCGVTVGQCHVLLELDAAGPLSLKELGERLHMDKAVLSRIVDGMVEVEMVTRRRTPSDRRFVRVALTPKGDQRVQIIHRSCDDFYITLLGELPEDEQEIVMKGVKTLIDRMRSLRKQPVDHGDACCGNEKFCSGEIYE